MFDKIIYCLHITLPSKMMKFRTKALFSYGVIFSTILLTFLPTSPLNILKPIKAQYEGEVIGATITTRGEEYDVEAEEGQSVILFPGCYSIDKVQVTFSNAVSGKFIVNHSDENPTDVDLDKVYEFCIIELEGFSKDDVRKAEFDLNVEKEWLSENAKKEEIRFFHFNEEEEKWEANDTSIKNENDDYVYYQTSSKEFPYFAVAAVKRDWIRMLIIPCVCVVIVVLVFVLLLLISSLIRRKQEPQQSRAFRAVNY